MFRAARGDSRRGSRFDFGPESFEILAGALGKTTRWESFDDVGERRLLGFDVALLAKLFGEPVKSLARFFFYRCFWVCIATTLNRCRGDGSKKCRRDQNCLNGRGHVGNSSSDVVCSALVSCCERRDSSSREVDFVRVSGPVNTESVYTGGTRLCSAWRLV